MEISESILQRKSIDWIPTSYKPSPQDSSLQPKVITELNILI